MNADALQSTAEPRAAAAEVAPPKRAIAGLVGILIAAIMAGLNNRVGALALADVRGAMGFDLDDASWLTTAYSTGEVIAMPFSAWFAITLSVRRFELWMIGAFTSLAVCIPFIHDLDLLLVMRFLQGVAGGTMIPVLMMAALKFLPPHIRLHGLALYALTATFAPNLSIWLTGQWTDGLFDWRWVYWQILPLAAIAALLVGLGLPKDRIQTDRILQANWPGMALGLPAFALIAVAVDQGVRLDWFNSPLIVVSLVGGLTLLGAYLLTEWYQPMPFIRLQMLSRRNLALGFILFICLLIVLTSGVTLPITLLGPLQSYRPRQMAPIGLIVALPQLVLGSAVALLLYRKWVDARFVFILGLLLIALACFLGAQLTPDWSRDQFVLTRTLQAFGQPMAIVSLLFLCTSVVHPSEGSYVSGTINTLRTLGSLIGGAAVGQFVTVRQRFHTEMLLDHSASASSSVPLVPEPAELMRIIGQQALVLSLADAYRMLGVMALVVVPCVLRMTYIPAPISGPQPLNPHRRPKDSSTMAMPKNAKIIISTLLLALAVGCVINLNRPGSSASTQSTDGAYVQADFTLVASQVSGVIDKVLVDENQAVKVGDLLAELDDRDFIVAMDAAKAQVAIAKASVDGLATRVTQQETAIRQAQSSIAMDDAELTLAEANQKRYRNLAADGSGSVQAQQEGRSAVGNSTGQQGQESSGPASRAAADGNPES